MATHQEVKVTSHKRQFSAGKVVGLIVGIVFGVLVVLAVLGSIAGVVIPQIQHASAKISEEKAKEAMIAEGLKPFYDQNKQRIFLRFHPIGTATAIRVNDVKITQWIGGEPTGRIEDKDVQGFMVDYTIYWYSPLHPGDGVTEVNDFYLRESGKFQFMRGGIVKTNGKTNSDITKDASDLLEMWMKSKLL